MPGLVPTTNLSDILVDPEIGWFERTGGGIGRYTVAHARMRMVRAEVVRARSVVFERLGLIAPGDEPVDARAIRQIRFQIHTPPRRLRRFG